MAVDVYEALRQLIHSILTDREVAAQYAEDPQGLLTTSGLTDGDLSTLDVRGVVGEVTSSLDLPPDARQSLESYVGGDPAPTHHPVQPPAHDGGHSPAHDGGYSPAHDGGHSPAHDGGHQGVEQIVEHLNYVTYVTYQQDTYITNQVTNNVDQSTHIDNSMDIDIDGGLYGEVEVDHTVVDQVGDGAVVNTGDGAVLNTGDGPVNAITGEVTDSVVNFGAGDVTNTADTTIDDSVLATDGSHAESQVTVETAVELPVGGHDADYDAGHDKDYQPVDRDGGYDHQPDVPSPTEHVPVS